MREAICIGGPEDGRLFSYSPEVASFVVKLVHAEAGHTYEQRTDISHVSGREVWLWKRLTEQ